MWKEARNQKRDKSAPAKAVSEKTPKATQEQIMIAKLVDHDNEDTQLRKNVSKIVEVTGVSEEKALLALYDSNDDPSRAIELLLERQTAGEDNGWETAGRRKNRGANSVTRNTDQTNTDTKTEPGDRSRSDRGGGTSKGRRTKGRTFDQSKSTDDVNNKENESAYNSRDRRPGRGRSRPGMGRGRGRGGAPRHSRHRQPGTKNDGSTFHSDAGDGLQDPVEVWENPKPTVKCWDIEVGTWSNKEAQKHREADKKSDADIYPSDWGAESWGEPNLSESRVFQAQNQVTAEPEVTTESSSIPTTADSYSGHERASNSIPKTGDRIDLGLLFKKMDTGIRNPAMQGSTNYSGLVNMTQGKSDSRNEGESSDGVPGIHQHCQVTYKDSNMPSNTVTSRLFGDYEQPQSKSIFQSDQSQNIMKSAFPQLNGGGPLHGQAKDGNSFLDSFSGLHSSAQNKSSQPDILSQLSGLPNVQPSMPSYSQMRMPIGKSSHADSATMDNFSKGRNESLLSFGSPLPPQLSQQTRQHRKATLPPKMPATAVEMPQNKGSPQDYNQFSLQFGSDDAASMPDPQNHDYDVNIPRSTPTNIMAQRNGLFMNKDQGQKSSASHSSGNVDSLFSSGMQMPSNSDHQGDELQSGSGVPTVDHTIKVPPGLNMSATTSSSFMPMTSADGQGNVAGSFLSRNLAADDGSGQIQDSGHHGQTSFSHEVNPYYVASTSNQSPKSRPGVNSSGPSSLSPVTQAQSHNQDNLETSQSALSSLTSALGQVVMSKSDSSVPLSRTSPVSYTSAAATSVESHAAPGPASTHNRKPVYNTVHDGGSDMSTMGMGMQQSQTGHQTADNAGDQTNSSYKAQTVSSPGTLGGFGSAKTAPVLSNKGNPSLPSGVTTPIQYGIHMPGIMPYPPEMQYGYDPLLLAQSRVVNPLNFYDVPFHGNTHTDNQDSSVPQNLSGHSKFNRGDVSSSTPPTQMGMPGAVSSDLTQHSSTMPMQAIPHKVTQSSTHLPGQQPYVGMPAYPNYGNLAAPYYSLGMANAGFQYPATMFAAAMHQAPKHAASSSDSFPQSSTRFNHTSCQNSVVSHKERKVVIGLAILDVTLIATGIVLFVTTSSCSTDIRTPDEDLRLYFEEQAIAVQLDGSAPPSNQFLPSSYASNYGNGLSFSLSEPYDSNYGTYLPGDQSPSSEGSSVGSLSSSYPDNSTVDIPNTGNLFPSNSQPTGGVSVGYASGPEAYQPVYGSVRGPTYSFDTRLLPEDLWRNHYFKCGVQKIKPSLRIMGGGIATTHSWPWAANLLKKSMILEYYYPVCGATIVSPRHAISALHCYKRSSYYKLAVGKQNQNVPGTEQSIAKIRPHPYGSVGTKTYYDFILITLQNELMFNDKIQPACLPKMDQNLSPGRKCWAYGWGNTMAGQGTNSQLRQVELEVGVLKECAEQYPIVSETIDKEYVICAGKELGRDTCKGDGGGPFTCQDNDRWVLFGATSWGDKCGSGKMSIFAAVSHSLSWFCCFMKELSECQGVACDPL